VLEAVDAFSNKSAAVFLARQLTLDCLVFPVQGDRPVQDQIAGLHYLYVRKNMYTLVDTCHDAYTVCGYICMS